MIFAAAAPPDRFGAAKLFDPALRSGSAYRAIEQVFVIADIALGVFDGSAPIAVLVVALLAANLLIGDAIGALGVGAMPVSAEKSLMWDGLTQCLRELRQGVSKPGGVGFARE